MVQFNKKDRELTQGIYEDMAEAVARAVARREATVACVHVAVFQHRFGTDISAHVSQDGAESALVAIARRECARDPDLRQRVIDRLGAWPAQDMDAGSLADLIELWSALADGESMWTVQCDVALDGHRDDSAPDSCADPEDGDSPPWETRWEA